jgi:CheY-like chemotaxis protein
MSDAPPGIPLPLHVLVVDHDDAAGARTIRRLLAEGCDVSIANVAWARADRAARLRPDIALVDVLMPGLRGEELSRLFEWSRGAGAGRVVVHTRILPGLLKRGLDMKDVFGVIRSELDDAEFAAAFRVIARRLPVRKSSGLHRLGESEELTPTLRRIG